MKQQDFDVLLADTTKQINGPIEWVKDDDHYPSVEFRVEVISQPKYPIFVNGVMYPPPLIQLKLELD